MSTPASFDPIWESKYAAGHSQRYPWDAVVSFVFRHAPKDKPRSETSILEVGCGTAANLWFAAREGFRAAGIDASESAIASARRRFAQDALQADLRVADFTRLPFPDGCFDLVVDRAALACCGRSAMRAAVAEVGRVLGRGGKFMFNTYADDHSSFRSGRPGPDGLVLDIKEGSLVGVGQLQPVSRRDLDEIFGGFWRMLTLERLERRSMLGDEQLLHTEWVLVAQKP